MITHLFPHTFAHSYLVGKTTGRPTPSVYSEAEGHTDMPVASK